MSTDRCRRIAACSYDKRRRPDVYIQDVDGWSQDNELLTEYGYGIQTLARRLRLGPLRNDILNWSGSSDGLKED
jgi:hypothetical protein